MRYLLYAVLLAGLLGGCEILGPDDDKEDEFRTYPEALELPAADLQKLLDGMHNTGQFNLTAFVVNIAECPPDFACLVADNIQVAASPHTDGPALMIATEKPSQFTLDQEYVLSIEVFGEPFPESQQTQFVRLLGYSISD